MSKNYFTKGELSMFASQEPIFNSAQMRIINKKTPLSEIELKKDSSGKQYKSVKAGYLKALVSLVTGGNYSFEIKSRQIIQESSEVLVEGRLSLHLPCGKIIVREQFGQFSLPKPSLTPESQPVSLNIGNAYKAAASDSFKKCASEMGFCWDIYNQTPEEEEIKQEPKIDYAEEKKIKKLEHFLSRQTDVAGIVKVFNQYVQTEKETPRIVAIVDKHMDRIGIKVNTEGKKKRLEASIAAIKKE